MDYLAQYGITIDALKKSTKPMVLVDTISKGEIIEGELVSGRQGRYILQVVYQKWIEAGNDPKDLLKKFNLVGMQVSTFREGERSNNYRYGDIDGLDQITAENETRLTSGNFSLEKLGRTIKVALIKDTQSADFCRPRS